MVKEKQKISNQLVMISIQLGGTGYFPWTNLMSNYYAESGHTVVTYSSREIRYNRFEKINQREARERNKMQQNRSGL
jgi:hypothetical protein